MSDLFAPTKSKKQMLLEWILSKDFTKTSEVILWGTRNYSNRALRDSQSLAQEGKIKRLSDEKKIIYFGLIKEDVWVRMDF